VEELKEHPSKGISNDDYGCRYVHSIFDEKTNSFEHFDGAIRMYNTDMMLMRIEKDIKSAGKGSRYTKLFRVDGELSISDWKTLVCHYYQANPLIYEYFDEARENEPHIIEQDHKTVIEELVPYSMNEGEGIRLFASYHSIKKQDEENEFERYISGYDVLSIGENSLRVIESDILEVQKVLKRLGSELNLPKNVALAYSEDLYWNIPTISHKLNKNLERNLAQTLEALRLIFEACDAKKLGKIVSFTLSWGRLDEKQITVSVMGHCKDILAWLKENKKIPIEKQSFKAWLENQSIFINKYKVNEDKPPLFEMVCSDGVLYIRRRGIQPDIKYQLEVDSTKGIMVAFYFPKEHFELATAYNNGGIEAALGYIHKKLECSKCKGDYFNCEHSKFLDNEVSVTVTDFELTSIVWTDRKA
jgi:hypothetical protein